jgi:chloride channel 7
MCHFAISLACVLATVSMIVAFGPAAAGSGVSLVMAYLNGLHVPKLLSAKTLVCKIIGTILTVASGLPLGPEGPLVHIGAGIASFFTRQHSFKIFGWQIGRGQGDQPSGSKSDFDMFNNDFDRREFISSGAAVGLAAAFGAPIGGVLYALEETSSFWSQRVTWRAILCTTLGTFTLALFQGRGHTVGASGLLSFAGQPNAYFVWELIPFVVIAMCGGSAGALFVATYKRAERYRRKTKIGKLCEATVVVLIVACVCFWVPLYGGRCIPRPEDRCNVDCSRVRRTHLCRCLDSAVLRVHTHCPARPHEFR